MLPPAVQLTSQKLCRRGTQGTFHNEQSASWCTLYVACAGVPATSATDAGPGSHGRAIEAQELRRAAVFCTRYRGRIVDLGRPAMAELP